MNKIFLTLKQPLIWLNRFPCRKGYNVHSPFAFDLITRVIYEKEPYYAYKELKNEEKKQAHLRDKNWKREPEKVKRLLFRLVNKNQPATIADIGTPSSSALYLQAGKKTADYISATDLTELFLEKGVPIDLLYLHNYKNPTLIEQTFQLCTNRIRPQSVCIIEGIGYTKPMKALWKQITTNEKVGITFDLYHLGIIYFDKTKIKQHYKVYF